MIDGELSESQVLGVQNRTDAVKAATELVVNNPALYLTKDPADAVIEVARKLFAYIQSGS